MTDLIYTVATVFAAIVAYYVMQCLSVCPSVTFVYSVKTTSGISKKILTVR